MLKRDGTGLYRHYRWVESTTALLASEGVRQVLNRFGARLDHQICVGLPLARWSFSRQSLAGGAVADVKSKRPGKAGHKSFDIGDLGQPKIGPARCGKRPDLVEFAVCEIPELDSKNRPNQPPSGPFLGTWLFIRSHTRTRPLPTRGILSIRYRLAV